MKRLVVLMLVSTLIMGILPGVAFATSGPDLGALGRYFPASTPIYIALGTSDADIAALDALLGVLRGVAPDEIPPDVGVADLLDLVGLQLVGDSFQNSIRPWLGDSAALAVFELGAAMGVATELGGAEEEPPLVFAFSVKDRAALDAFMERLVIRNFNSGMFEIVTVGDLTLYSSTVADVDAGFILSDDVFMLGNSKGIDVITSGVQASLLDNPDFTSAMALLPAAGYNLAMYVNAEPFVTEALAEAEAEGLVLPEGAFDVLSSAVVMGLGLVNNAALVLDMAQPGVDGMMLPATPPLDPMFAAHIPADAVLAFQSANLSGVFSSVAEAWAIGLEEGILQALAMADMEEMVGDPLAEFEAGVAEMEAGLAMVDAQFTAATGLNFEEDVIGWMTGDYAAFVRLDNEMLMVPAGSELPFDLGLIVEVTDSAAVQTMMEGLLKGLKEAQDEGMTVSQAAVGGGSAIVLDVPAEETGDMAVQILLAADDSVFALGTRGAAEAALMPEAGGLAGDARFAEASEFVLAGSEYLVYANLSAIEPLMMMEATPQEAAEMQIVLQLVRSLSLSGLTMDDGSSVARLAIPLGG